MSLQKDAPVAGGTSGKGDVQPRKVPAEQGPLGAPAAFPEPSPPEWAVETLKLDFAKTLERRRRTFLGRLGLFVGLPTLLATIYVYLYATPRYVSEIQVVYQSYGQSQTQTSSGLLSLLGSGTGSLDMQRVIDSYIKSDTLLNDVDKKLNLRAHYSNPKVDWLDRLPSNASQEDFVKYFQKRVSVNVMIGGYDVVDVEAFDPVYAARVAQAMSDNIDAMVEKMTTRARDDEMNFARSEVDRAEKRLLQAKLNTTNFRNAHRDFDPGAAATTLETTVVGGLETELAQYTALLASRRRVLGEDSPTVQTLESQVSSLEQQIQTEHSRLASGGTSKGGAVPSGRAGSQPYSDVVAQYTALTTDEQFATDSYVSAKQALDLARADAARKENYVETFVRPSVAQEATSPDPFTTIATTFVVSLLAYVIGSLFLSTFREQAGM